MLVVAVKQDMLHLTNYEELPEICSEFLVFWFFLEFLSFGCLCVNRVWSVQWQLGFEAIYL